MSHSTYYNEQHRRFDRAPSMEPWFPLENCPGGGGGGGGGLMVKDVTKFHKWGRGLLECVCVCVQGFIQDFEFCVGGEL